KLTELEHIAHPIVNAQGPTLDDDAIVPSHCQASRYNRRVSMHRPLLILARCAMVLVCALASACSRPARLAADLVITRANIWTGEPMQPGATALAIIGDRIVDVGGADAMERWRGSQTMMIDAEGRRVVPGFNDAHVHFVDGGTQLDSVDLKDADSPQEFARRIAARAKSKPGEWILGGDWD